ncbi:hypothetical protein A3Q56_02623 [Intoshia linei]|uniref:Rab-GAP TBC domain-containing protein n=1 Tax=Intoshia linei TaxID=1819745 RepID=A0A177B7R9_9BILA|nr:hypothetical protein A3Q56_02623 [Intoshia linei]
MRLYMYGSRYNIVWISEKNFNKLKAKGSDPVSAVLAEHLKLTSVEATAIQTNPENFNKDTFNQIMDMFIIDTDLIDSYRIKNVSIIFSLRPVTTFPSIFFSRLIQLRNFIDAMKSNFSIAPSMCNKNVFQLKSKDDCEIISAFNTLNLFDDDKEIGVVQKFVKNPKKTVLNEMSKITGYMSFTTSERSSSAREPSEYAFYSLDAENLADQGNICYYNNSEDDYDHVYQIPERKCLHRENFLNTAVWEQSMESNGSINNDNKNKILEIIFRGGVQPEIRNEVWSFILGIYDWNSTFDERQHIRAKNSEYFFKARQQWKSMDQEQMKRNSSLQAAHDCIVKDVRRTDRELPEFEQDESQCLKDLFDILMTHTMDNFDLGYVQGMNDICAPLFRITNNITDIYWLFKKIMIILRLLVIILFLKNILKEPNFVNMKENIVIQINNVNKLLRFIDLKLFTALDAMSEKNHFYYFQWILLLFKRSFPIKQIYNLWEVYFTNKPCKNYNIIMIVALMIHNRNKIVEKKMKFYELYKLIKTFTKDISTSQLLSSSEEVFLQIAGCRDLPNSIEQITYIRLDMIRRMLKFSNFNNILCMGITDIDDKIINKGIKLNKPSINIANIYFKEFIQNLNDLNIHVDKFCKVSNNINEIINFIKILIKKKSAYATTVGNVYFHSGCISAKKLFMNTKNDEYTSIKSDSGKDKLTTSDFALWKTSKEGWASPWGIGRPGWHIECSAMATNIFGDEIDIHYGGEDIMIPHHQNEIIQSECFHNSKWVNCWIHSGTVHVEKLNNIEKMSKSLNNYTSIDQFLSKHHANVLRMICFSRDIRSKINYNETITNNSIKLLQNFQNYFDHMDYLMKKENVQVIDESNFLKVLTVLNENIVESISDNFNAKRITDSLFEAIQKIQTECRIIPITPKKNNRYMLLYAKNCILDYLENFGFDKKPFQMNQPHIYSKVSTNENDMLGDIILMRNEIRSLSKKVDKDTSTELFKLSDKIREILHDKYSINMKDK